MKKSTSTKTAATKSAASTTEARAIKDTTAASKGTAAETRPGAASKTPARPTRNQAAKERAARAAERRANPPRVITPNDDNPPPRPAPPARKVVKKKVSGAAVKTSMKKLPKTAFSAATGTDTNQPFTEKELAKFSAMILEQREENAVELEELSDQLREMAANEGADDNSYSLHMAEQGTDAMEREKTFLQAQRTSDYLKKLDEAQARIQSANFGICRICGLRLDSRRLMAVPVTQVCTVYKNTSKPCQPGKHYLDTFGEEEE